ncbi:substrate-binding domain-containing protein [Delftia sp. SD018]|uniref:substrate-binding domain-containing protein n=1 Tax=unclassified Delftia TaxID=2613839 RepID=UPI001A95E73E|nr:MULTISPECIES: substrate-binding domain-containing protein [unclassified Delftia]MBO0990747.1 substrate-binding domain-containing protein [Delftia sp. SD083]MBO1034939.1 substrate-binding domain-containing protein [Delftia sp. SD018]
MTAIRSTPLPPSVQSSVPSTLRRRTLGALLGGALSLGLALGAATPSTAAADEIRVVTSGGFSAAYDQLIPLYEQATGHKVVTSRGASMGNAQDSIPSRLARGEQFDIVILADGALDNLAAQGKVEAGSRVDLARSMIGMSVRKGTPKPDISTVDALKQTLLDAKTIAYSASASGTYLANELFPRLGVAEQMKGKATRILSERVGAVVLRGDADIGFQQVSELLPFKELEFVGPLPDEVQQRVFFSAGVATGTKSPDTARHLIRFLAAPAAAPIVRSTGMEPAAKP